MPPRTNLIWFQNGLQLQRLSLIVDLISTVKLGFSNGNVCLTWFVVYARPTDDGPHDSPFTRANLSRDCSTGKCVIHHRQGCYECGYQPPGKPPKCFRDEKNISCDCLDWGSLATTWCLASQPDQITHLSLNNKDAKLPEDEGASFRIPPCHTTDLRSSAQSPPPCASLLLGFGTSHG